jgi:hypothetical protein
MEERRQASREKSLLRGSVRFGHSGSSMECIVRDISNIGARLKLSSDRPRHGPVELNVPLKNQTFKGTVQWQEGGEVGLAFESAIGEGSADKNHELSVYAARLEAYASKLEAEIAELYKTIERLSKKPNIRL